MAAGKEPKDVEGGMRWTERQKTRGRRVDRGEREERDRRLK